MTHLLRHAVKLLPKGSSEDALDQLLLRADRKMLAQYGTPLLGHVWWYELQGVHHELHSPWGLWNGQWSYAPLAAWQAAGQRLEDLSEPDYDEISPAQSASLMAGAEPSDVLDTLRRGRGHLSLRNLIEGVEHEDALAEHLADPWGHALEEGDVVDQGTKTGVQRTGQ